MEPWPCDRLSSLQINLDSMQESRSGKHRLVRGPLVLEDRRLLGIGCSVNPGLAISFPLMPLIRSFSHPGIL